MNASDSIEIIQLLLDGDAGSIDSGQVAAALNDAGAFELIALDADLRRLAAPAHSIAASRKRCANLPMTDKFRTTGKSNRSRAGWALWAAAASVLLLTGVYAAWRAAGGPVAPGYPLGPLNVPATKPARFEVEGGIVWARGGATLSVEAPRRVKLSNGSAFFEVTPGKGKFTVECPDGTISVLGTQFTVSTSGKGCLVALRKGSVRIENGSGNMLLHPGEAGELTASAPLLIAASVAEQTLWRPWSALSPEETAERMECLRTILSAEDYGARLRARACLDSAGSKGVGAASAWLTNGSARLKLEVVLLPGRLRRGEPEGRALLRRVAEDRAEATELRIQALRVLRAAGTVEDVAWLSKLIGANDAQELSEAALATLQSLRDN